MMENIKRLDVSLLMGDKIHVKSLNSFNEIGMHSHNYYELIYFRKGDVISTINGIKHRFGDNTLYLLTPFDVHETVYVKKGESVDFTNISFTEDAVDGNVLNNIGGVYIVDDTGPNNDISSLVLLIENMSAQRDTEAELNKRYLLTVLLSLIVKRGRLFNDDGGIFTADREIIRNASKYVAENYTQKITLEDIVNYLHLSPTYFSSAFSKAAGMTFTDYLCNYRLNCAKYLLVSTDLSVTEVCMNSGFSSYSRFSRVFKDCVGVTPTEYRQNTAK